MNLLLAILSQIAVFVPLSIGVFLNTLILKITDLTIDGSFLLGGAAFTLAAINEFSPVMGILFAIFAGAATGLISSLFQTQKRIDPIIASILTTFIAHGVFFFMLSGPNISLYGKPTLFNYSPLLPGWSIAALVCMLLSVSIKLILSSSVGLTLKAFGAQEKILHQLGKNTEWYRHLGLALSNACAGLSGALTAQQNGYADISMGFGMALIGISSVLIGKHLWKTAFQSSKNTLLFCYAGSTFYFVFIKILLAAGINPLYLKGILGILIGLLLQFSSRR
jgi:putative ABC transport system permease protein